MVLVEYGERISVSHNVEQRPNNHRRNAGMNAIATHIHTLFFFLYHIVRMKCVRQIDESKCIRKCVEQKGQMHAHYYNSYQRIRKGTHNMHQMERTIRFRFCFAFRICPIHTFGRMYDPVNRSFFSTLFQEFEHASNPVDMCENPTVNKKGYTRHITHFHLTNRFFDLFGFSAEGKWNIHSK